MLKQSSLLITFVFLCIALTYDASAQTLDQCKDIIQTIDDSMGYTVKSVDIKGRWVPEDVKAQVATLARQGKPFNKPAISAAHALISQTLQNEEDHFNFGRGMGSFSVLYVNTSVCDISLPNGPREVSIILRPYYIHIDLYNSGNNLVPVPRSPSPSFRKHVPKAILATSPLLGFTSDRQYGPALFLQTNSDLLHLQGFSDPDKGSKKFNLDAGLNARKSLSEAFYTVGAGLNFSRPVLADNLIGWNMGVYYDQSLQPLSAGHYKRQFTQLYGAIQGSLRMAFPDKYSFGGSINFMKNQYKILQAKDLGNTENNYGLFASGTGKIGKGFTRLGIWFDAGAAGGNSNVQRYNRIAGRMAYAVSLGAGHQTVDLETMIGSGYSWGSTLPYNQFYAGNTSQNFLYESLTSVVSHSMPDGPVMRSLGEKQGTLLNAIQNITSGGNAYYHINLSISVPFVKWSKPLIPAIVAFEETKGDSSTLPEILKGQVNTANALINQNMVDKGAPDDQSTTDAAKRIVDKEIRPAVNYIADKANIYSIKPILLFDAARLTDRSLPGTTWVGAGAGVQLNIVNARLETGYMRTLSPSKDASSGNFFFRFVIQNIF